MTGEELYRIVQQWNQSVQRCRIVASQEALERLAPFITESENRRVVRERTMTMVPTLNRIQMELEGLAGDLDGLTGDVNQNPIAPILHRHAERLAELFTHGTMKPAFDAVLAKRIIEEAFIGNNFIFTSATSDIIVNALVNEMVFATKMSAGFSVEHECASCHGPIEDEEGRVVCRKCELNAALGITQTEVETRNREISSLRHDLEMLTGPNVVNGTTLIFESERGWRRIPEIDNSRPLPQVSPGVVPNRETIRGQTISPEAAEQFMEFLSRFGRRGRRG